MSRFLYLGEKRFHHQIRENNLKDMNLSKNKYTQINYFYNSPAALPTASITTDFFMSATFTNASTFAFMTAGALYFHCV